MTQEYVEHINATVKDLNHASQFLLTAMPTWRIRGRGRMDWFGKPVEWLHVGTDASYVALQSGGEGDGLNWREHQAGVKHVGLVVPSLAQVIERLAQAGFAVDHMGPNHPFRKSAYFIQADNLQFEFIEYLSTLDAERNAYERPAAT